MTVLDRMTQSVHAPRFRDRAGDRLGEADRAWLRELADALGTRRGRSEPDDEVERYVAGLRDRVPSFRERVPVGYAVLRDWDQIPTSCREDVALRPESLVPDDADTDEMVVYRTAGTTGHALLVPSHPRAAGAYQPLLEFALGRWALHLDTGPDRVAGFLVGAQVSTVTYATTLSFWNDAGWAKLNLQPTEWNAERDPHAYFDEQAPALLTGDPISFSEMLRRQIPARPVALVSTAVAMSEGLRRLLGQRYACPVIDWYSLTETGPIGFRCPKSDAYHVLPHDLFVEAVDEVGAPVAPGERGEITVSGGRNPFLPLLRYRTGDWGRLDAAPCPCGDPGLRLFDLEGRPPVLFRAAGGTVVNPVDVSRVLRAFPFVQHELVQSADGSLDLSVRPAPGVVPDTRPVEQAIRELFGDTRLRVTLDERLGDRAGKAFPYRSELRLED